VSNNLNNARDGGEGGDVNKYYCQGPRAPHICNIVCVCVCVCVFAGQATHFRQFLKGLGHVKIAVIGSVTLKRIGLFCFPIKHSTHTEWILSHFSLRQWPLSCCTRIFSPLIRAVQVLIPDRNSQHLLLKCATVTVPQSGPFSLSLLIVYF